MAIVLNFALSVVLRLTRLDPVLMIETAINIIVMCPVDCAKASLKLHNKIGNASNSLIAFSPCLVHIVRFIILHMIIQKTESRLVQGAKLDGRC